MWALLAVLIVIVVVICVTRLKGRREHYGGPVKMIRRIPLNACLENCAQYYRSCMADFRHVDASLCATRYRNCASVCRHTDFHTL